MIAQGLRLAKHWRKSLVPPAQKDAGRCPVFVNGIFVGMLESGHTGRNKTPRSWRRHLLRAKIETLGSKGSCYDCVSSALT